MKLLFAVGLCAIATGASAQINTSCNTIGQQTNCFTTTPPPQVQLLPRQPYDSTRGLASGQSIVDFASQAQAEAASRVDQAVATQRRRRVGQLIQAGRCPDGVALALREGDIALAGQAKALCD